MNVLPIIARELRAEARRPANYWLRMSGAACLLALLLFFGLPRQGLTPNIGAPIFGSLSLTLFALIWVVVPMMTADCLSHEKRDGTLGLLFLTPLSAGDVVTAKGIVHALRAVTLLLAAVPVLMIPVLMGGVTWMDAARAVLLNLGAVGLALTAGLLASSWCREWRWAMLVAMSVSFVSAFLFFLVYVSYRIYELAQLVKAPLTAEFFSSHFLFYLRSCLNRLPFLGTPRASPADMKSLWLAGGLLIFSGVLAALVMWLAARRIRKAWREQPLSARQEKLREFFCQPRFWRSLVHQRTRRQLDRNPIAWLQQYSTNARLTKWLWCLLVAAAFGLTVGDNSHDLPGELQLGLLLLLWAGMAVSAAGSFRRERALGAMELLLVTPMTARSIVWGQIQGLWHQFLPAILVFILNCFALGDLAASRDDSLIMIGVLVVNFITLPVIGLYFALRIKYFFVAWLLSFLVPTILTDVLWWTLRWLFENYLNQRVRISGFNVFAGEGFLVQVGIQCALAIAAMILAERALTQRTFLFKPA